MKASETSSIVLRSLRSTLRTTALDVLIQPVSAIRLHHLQRIPPPSAFNRHRLLNADPVATMRGLGRLNLQNRSSMRVLRLDADLL